MRERFEQQMEILHTELIELGALCEQAIGRTYEVLLEGRMKFCRVCERELPQMSSLWTI